MVESAEQRVETRSKPEVELIGLKVVAMVESAKVWADTRLRPKVELMELLDQKGVQMREMVVWAELVENIVDPAGSAARVELGLNWVQWPKDLDSGLGSRKKKSLGLNLAQDQKFWLDLVLELILGLDFA